MYSQRAFVICCFMALVAICLPPFSYSQQAHNHTIFFPSGSATLSPESQKTLAALAERLRQAKADFVLEISGHADNVGLASHNQYLSLLRAKNTALGLSSKGISSSKMVTTGMGSSIPIASNETASGQAQNRRVEIAITIQSKPAITIGGIGLETENFSVNSKQESTLNSSSGVLIQIPSYAFTDRFGQPVSGDVMFHFRAFKHPMDFVLAGIPMEFENANENGHLSSVGMFEIRATQNGKELQLAKGKEINVTSQIDGNTDGVENFVFDDLLQKWLKTNRISGSKPRFNETRSWYKNFCNRKTQPMEFKTDWALFWTIYRASGTGLFVGVKNSSDSLFHTQTQVANREIMDSIIGIKQALSDFTDSISSIKAQLHEGDRKYSISRSNRLFGKSFYELDVKASSQVKQEPLHQVKWKPSATSNNIPDSILGVEWPYARIIGSPEDGLYNILFESETDSFLAKNLELEQRKRGIRKADDTWLKRWHGIFQKNTTQFYKQWQQLSELRQAQNRYQQIHLELLNKLEILAIDSQLSSAVSWEEFEEEFRQLLPGLTPESNHVDSFLRYFDQHRIAILDSALALVAIKKSYPIMEIAPNPNQSSRPNQENNSNLTSTSTNDIAQRFAKPITVTWPAQSMGFYNYDVIVEPPSDLLAKPQYISASGRTIDVHALYVFTEGINGVVRYTRNSAFTPERFPLPINGNNQLLLIDKSGKEWMVQPSAVALLKKAIVSKEKQVIEASPIGLVKDRKALMELVVI